MRAPARPPEHYIHANGAVVVVPAHVAYAMDCLLDLNRVRTAVRGRNADLDNVLVALRFAAMSYAGQPPRTSADVDPPSQWLTTQTAAGLLGIDPRSVRRLAGRGILAGERHGTNWMVSRESIEQYAARLDRAA